MAAETSAGPATPRTLCFDQGTQGSTPAAKWSYGIDSTLRLRLTCKNRKREMWSRGTQQHMIMTEKEEEETLNMFLNLGRELEETAI